MMGDDKYYYGLVSEQETGDCIEYQFVQFSLEKFARWYLSYADVATIVRPRSSKREGQKHLASHLCLTARGRRKKSARYVCFSRESAVSLRPLGNRVLTEAFVVYSFYLCSHENYCD